MKRAMRRMRKTLVLVACIALVCGLAIGGTVAWLSATTNPVVNTFTPSNINITLTETLPANKTAEMVPGNSIDKNPKVTVEANSEACWLFVKITEAGGNVTVGDTTYSFDDFITYTVDENWTPLPQNDGVYYREVNETTADTPFDILSGNTVTVKQSVTKAMMDALQKDSSKNPTLTFKAYAVQKANIKDVGNAWTQAQGAGTAYDDAGANTSNALPTTAPSNP